MSDERFLSDDIEALLRTPEMWSDPSPHVADAVERETQEASRPRRSMATWAMAGAAAVVIAVTAFLATTQPAEPDWTVALAAAPESGIAGEVSGWNEATGTRVVLTIDNLDPAQSGTFYEVWWVDLESGGAVSSGSFLEQDEAIEMWMGIRRSEFPKMLITLEPTDGDPGRSDAVIAWSDD